MHSVLKAWAEESCLVKLQVDLCDEWSYHTDLIANGLMHGFCLGVVVTAAECIRFSALASKLIFRYDIYTFINGYSVGGLEEVHFLVYSTLQKLLAQWLRSVHRYACSKTTPLTLSDSNNTTFTQFYSVSHPNSIASNNFFQVEWTGTNFSTLP